MAGGLFTRQKIWDDFETLFNEDLNAEFNNIINNLDAFKLGGASENATQLLATFDPGEVGAENLPSSVAEELQALRYQIEAILGTSAWIDDPPTSLFDVGSTLNTAGLLRANRIVSGLSDASGQPQWLRAEGSAAQVNLLTSTDLITFINGSQVTFDSDLNFSGLSLAPNTNNTALVADATLSGAESTKLVGERGSALAIGTIGTEISALNGKIAAFKLNNGVDDEYFLAQVDTTAAIPCLKNAYRGYFFDDAGLSVPRITISNGDTITLMRLAWVFATNTSGTKAIDVTLNQPFVQDTAPSAPGSGDYWFDIVNDQWKKFTGASFEVTDAILIGLCIQDSANCVATRSADLTKVFSSKNTAKLEVLNVNEVKTTLQGTNISVYGEGLYFEKAYLTWSMPGDLDSGESESMNMDYYLYVTPTGDPVLSTVPPHDRSAELSGEYHPSKPYRAVGKVVNDGSADFSLLSSYSDCGRNDYSPGATGDIKMYTNVTPPDGWLICDGLEVSRSEYSSLFKVIGDSLGVGDGTTTFNLPDLRERKPSGLNNASTPNGVSGLPQARNLGDLHGSDTHDHPQTAHSHQNTDQQFAWAFSANAPAPGGETGSWDNANSPLFFSGFLSNGGGLTAAVITAGVVWDPAAWSGGTGKAYTERASWSTDNDGATTTGTSGHRDPGATVNMIIKY